MLDEDVADFLSTDGVLQTTLTGKVWDRSLKRRGPFSTPEAFNPVAPHDILPAAVVSNSGRTSDLCGPPGAYTGYLTVWLHGPEGPLASQSLQAAAERVIALLWRQHFTAS